jgi:cysteine desulfurase
VTIYLDNAATTPLLLEVQTAIVDSFPLFGNPSSLHHLGVEAEQLISTARRGVLKCLGGTKGKLLFTGSGTEANNMAIMGVVSRHGQRGKHVVTTKIEHPSVLRVYEYLERRGFSVTYVSPDASGNIAAHQVLDALREDTILVSMMHVNNETGAILPVVEVGQALRTRPKTFFHVDGIQAYGKIPNCARIADADLYSVSGHKVGAPKGIGALYIREGLAIDPLLHGGGQEFGLRSGTENVLGIVALGRATESSMSAADLGYERMELLCQTLRQGLEKIPKCQIQRSSQASPYIVSAAFPGLRGEVLVHALETEGLYASTGSACSSKGGHSKSSHVLAAMGKSDIEITGTLRFSMGRQTSLDEIHRAIEIVQRQTEWLYQLEGS